AQRDQSLKQWQVPAAYKQFKPELTSIGRHLTFKQSKSSQEQGAPPNTAAPTPQKQLTRSVDSYDRLVCSGSTGDSATSTANTGNDWVGRIVLQNSNNLCYLNALRRIGALGMSASRGVLLTAQLQVARHQEGFKSFVPVWPDSEVRLPFLGSELAVEWLRCKVMAVVEHHGEQVSSGHYRAVLRGLSDWLHMDDGVSATVVSFDRDRAELSYLFWAVRAQESEEAPDANMLEGEQEWDFYTKYWPSGPGIPAPPSSEGSTAEPSGAIEEREAKAAKLLDSKGGQGRGSGDGKGFAGNGGSDQAAPKGPQGAHKRQQRDLPSQWRGGGGGGGSGGGSGNGNGGRASWGSNWRGNDHAADGDEWSLRKEVQDLKYAVSLMQRLILRHEDASILARIESSFVLHFKLNVPASVVPMLFTSAVAWRKIKAEEPQRLDRPMRCALLVCLFAELKERMSTGAVGGDGQVVDTSSPPLSQAEILEYVGRLITLIPRKFTTARFHPTRPMTQVMTGQNLVFLLQTGQHGESSAEMRDMLRKLCYCSVMHLLAAQLKEDRHARSALANAIADYLSKYSGNR
ncbi:unnamed protein product, partial [Symbiodinium necroappetens]